MSFEYYRIAGRSSIWPQIIFFELKPKNYRFWAFKILVVNSNSIFDMNFELQKVELRVCDEAISYTSNSFGSIPLSITVQELWFLKEISVPASFDPRQGFQSKTVSRLFSYFSLVYQVLISNPVSQKYASIRNSFVLSYWQLLAITGNQWKREKNISSEKNFEEKYRTFLLLWKSLRHYIKNI